MSIAPKDALIKRFRKANSVIGQQSAFHSEGKLTRLIGMTLEVEGIRAQIGSKFFIEHASGELKEAEVIGFVDDKTYHFTQSRLTHF